MSRFRFIRKFFVIALKGIREFIQPEHYQSLRERSVKTCKPFTVWWYEQRAKTHEKLRDYETASAIYEHLYGETGHYNHAAMLATLKTANGDFSNTPGDLFRQALQAMPELDCDTVFHYYDYMLQGNRLSHSEVMQYSHAIQQPKTSEKIAKLALIFLEVDETDLSLTYAVQLLSPKHRAELRKFIKVTELLDRQNMELTGIERQLAEMHRQILQNQRHFEQEVRESSIVIVGNSPCETGRHQGSQIDNNDLIARFNNFPNTTDSDYSIDYGKKTDVWMRSTGKWVLPRDVSSFRFIILTNSFSCDWSQFQPYLDQGVSLLTCPQQYQNELTAYLQAPPSTGIILLYYIYRVKQKISQENAYGFSFTDQLENNKFVNIGGTTASHRHEWHREKELYEKMLRNAL